MKEVVPQAEVKERSRVKRSCARAARKSALTLVHSPCALIYYSERLFMRNILRFLLSYLTKRKEIPVGLNKTTSDSA